MLSLRVAYVGAISVLIVGCTQSPPQLRAIRSCPVPIGSAYVTRPSMTDPAQMIAAIRGGQIPVDKIRQMLLGTNCFRSVDVADKSGGPQADYKITTELDFDPGIPVTRPYVTGYVGQITKQSATATLTLTDLHSNQIVTTSTGTINRVDAQTFSAYSYETPDTNKSGQQVILDAFNNAVSNLLDDIQSKGLPATRPP